MFMEAYVTKLIGSQILFSSQPPFQCGFHELLEIASPPTYQSLTLATL